MRVTIAPQPGAIPHPWQHGDIGFVGRAGSATYSDGVFSVTGSGADIWGTADAFHFLYARTGDFGADLEVTSRVGTVQNIHAWTKAGVMLRASLDADSPHASLIVSPGKGIAFQRRLTTGGASVSTQGPLLTAPVWVRLTTQMSSSNSVVRALLPQEPDGPVDAPRAGHLPRVESDSFSASR